MTTSTTDRTILSLRSFARRLRAPLAAGLTALTLLSAPSVHADPHSLEEQQEENKSPYPELPVLEDEHPDICWEDGAVITIAGDQTLIEIGEDTYLVPAGRELTIEVLEGQTFYLMFDLFELDEVSVHHDGAWVETENLLTAQGNDWNSYDYMLGRPSLADVETLGFYFERRASPRLTAPTVPDITVKPVKECPTGRPGKLPEEPVEPKD